MKLEELVENFEILGDWEERYRYIIDLGRKLPAFPEEERTRENQVTGCLSQVWLVARESEADPNVLEFFADSDAHIVRGLIGIALKLFSHKTASEILTIDIKDVFSQLGLDEHLSANRRGGFQSLLKKIKGFAEARA